MQEVEISQSPLKSINPNDYTISIRLRPGGFCFALYCKPSNEFTALYDVKANNVEEMLTIWKNMGIDANQFCHVDLVEDCEKWTLIPQDMEGLDTETLWLLNYGTKPATDLQKANVGLINAKCIYEGGSESNKLKERIPNLTVRPVQVADINYATQESQIEGTDYIGIDIREKQFHLYLLKRGQMKLANSFAYESDADVLYFVMNTLRTFQLSQTETKVELWGKVDESIVKQLRQYIKQVSVATPSNRHNYANGIKRLNSRHEYYDLFNIVTCAL